MEWAFEKACENFDRYRPLWDDLNRKRGNHILLDSLFISSLVRHFASSGVLVAISLRPSSPGMVLVERTGKGFWQTFQPSQGPLGLILLENADGMGEQIGTLISSLPGYALGFSVLQQDPDSTSFGNLNGCVRTEVLEYMTTPRLTLRGTFEDYWRSRGKNLVHNLDRQHRRLEKQGYQLRLVTEKGVGQVKACIEDYGSLESKGWKAREQTAVTAENRQGLFYKELLENFCRREEAVIYRLVLGNKTIASDLCLERDGILVVLKTAYDETIEGISPGLLLHQEIFKALFAERRVKVVEFYGRVRDWHLKWTNEVRTMYHVNFYRNRWVSTIRRSLKRSRELLAVKATTE